MKTVFISYSHDSEEHKSWVKKFAQDLRKTGNITVLYDQDLPKGTNLTRFMQNGICSADRVLVIGTPTYKQKSLRSSGVAYEEAIIGADIMNDIDTTKYYPILRNGSFKDSFPNSLASRIGDDLSDDTQYQTKLNDVINSILNDSSSSCIQMFEISKTENHNIASLYLGLSVLFETIMNQPTGVVNGVAFTVTLTNKSKEVRYYNEPYFKSSVSFDGMDSFKLLNKMMPEPSFPIRLELGQVVTQAYVLTFQHAQLFKQWLSKDANASITAVVETTLGESIESEPYRLSALQENFKYFK